MTRRLTDDERCGAPTSDGGTCRYRPGHAKRAGHQSLAAIRKASNARYRRRVDKLIAQLGGRCVACDVTRNLEFDHRDWRTKVEAITGLITHGASPEVIAAELAKCQLLCRPCHKEKSARDRAERRAERKAQEAA